MTTRHRLTAVALVASLALFAGACSGSDEDGSKKSNNDKTETSEKTDGKSDGKSSETSESPDETAAPISDDEFTTKVDKISSTIKDAGTDLCKLSMAQNTEPPEPTNPKQVEAVVKVYSQLLRAMSEVLPSSAATSATSLKKAADDVEKAAKDAKYSKDFFSSNSLVTVLSDAGVSEGISAFAEATKGCSGGADMSSPSSTPQG